jgi:hypothetical protein
LGGQGLEDVPAALSGGGDHGAERGEVLSGFESPEGAGDFHLHLHHAQSLFGEVVGEGNGEVGEEPQHIVFEPVQSDQQIVSGAMFRPAAIGGAPGQAGQLAMIGKPELEQFPIAVVEGLRQGWTKGGFVPLARFIHRPVGFKQEIAHRLGPRIELDQRLQFAQVVGVAERVSDAVKAAVGLKPSWTMTPPARSLGISPRLAETR